MLGGAGAIGIDHHESRPPPLGGERMIHHVHLGIHGIPAPDHHQVRVVVDLAQVGAPLHPRPRDPAAVGQRHADGGEPAGVPHDVAQPVDAVPLHQPHGARVVVGPHGLRAQCRRPRPGRRAPRCRAPRPRRCGRTAPSPWDPRASWDASAGRDDGCAPRSGPPSRRSRRACTCCAGIRAPGRWSARPAAPRPARTCWCSRAGRRTGTISSGRIAISR